MVVSERDPRDELSYQIFNITLYPIPFIWSKTVYLLEMQASGIYAPPSSDWIRTDDWVDYREIVADILGSTARRHDRESSFRRVALEYWLGMSGVQS